MRTSRDVAALLLTTGAVLAAAGPAAAHGRLAESDPADGAALTAPPEQLTMWFTELPSRDATFVVTAPDGTPVQGAWRPGEPRPLREPVQELALVDGTWTPVSYDVGHAAVVPVTTLPAAGVYRVAYDSVASDGEQVTGTTSFTYRGAPVPPAAGAQVSEGGAVAADAVFPEVPPPAPSSTAAEPRALGPASAAATQQQEDSGPSVPVLVALAVVAVVAANVALVRRRAVTPPSRHTSGRAGRGAPARRPGAARSRSAPVSPRGGAARSRRR